jgi:hypothetical protein
LSGIKSECCPPSGRNRVRRGPKRAIAAPNNYWLAATEPPLLRFAKGNRELLQAIAGKAPGSLGELARYRYGGVQPDWRCATGSRNWGLNSNPMSPYPGSFDASRKQYDELP